VFDVIVKRSRNKTEEQEVRSKMILISRWIVARELVQTQLHRDVAVNNDSKIVAVYVNCIVVHNKTSCLQCKYNCSHQLKCGYILFKMRMFSHLNRIIVAH